MEENIQNNGHTCINALESTTRGLLQSTESESKGC